MPQQGILSPEVAQDSVGSAVVLLDAFLRNRLADPRDVYVPSTMQGSLEQAVQMEEGRLAAVALRSKCRKLESESLFADVFEKYKEEIRQLEVSQFSCIHLFANPKFAPLTQL